MGQSKTFSAAYVRGRGPATRRTGRSPWHFRGTERSSPLRFDWRFEGGSSSASCREAAPWTADGILVRGSGPTDVLPLGEPTLHGAVQCVFGLLRPPTDDELLQRAEAWRPFRTWMSVFLISHDFEQARLLAKRLPERGAPVPRRGRCELG